MTLPVFPAAAAVVAAAAGGQGAGGAAGPDVAAGAPVRVVAAAGVVAADLLLELQPVAISDTATNAAPALAAVEAVLIDSPSLAFWSRLVADPPARRIQQWRPYAAQTVATQALLPT